MGVRLGVSRREGPGGWGHQECSRPNTLYEKPRYLLPTHDLSLPSLPKSFIEEETRITRHLRLPPSKHHPQVKRMGQMSILLSVTCLSETGEEEIDNLVRRKSQQVFHREVRFRKSLSFLRRNIQKSEPSVFHTKQDTTKKNKENKTQF